MIVTLLVHFQILVDRQREYEFPDSVQPLLRKDGGAVCFFRKQIFSGGDKRSDPLVNFVQYCLVQVHYVGTALSNRVLFLADKNVIAVEEYGELIISVRVCYFGALQLLCHICSLTVSD